MRPFLLGQLGRVVEGRCGHRPLRGLQVAEVIGVVFGMVVFFAVAGDEDQAQKGGEEGYGGKR